ncbi:hypothetical protein BGZ93_000849 [Podila epicladia]|nr:hypothetical protein BGZ92_007688 [Podila epicladia]KAG0098190.1 hypothetical protein BGZ93_000849 [Podila epicladia]
MTERETTWTTDAAAEDSTPSYASAIIDDSRNDLTLQRLQGPLPPLPSPSSPTASGLQAALELDSDTIDIYDRSNDSFQYSLKGTVELNWTGDKELLLKEARIDFLGYADTAVLRYESGISNNHNSTTATETPVHHTHDFIPTPFVLAPATPTSTTTIPTKHHETLAIDITLPGHLPDSTNISIGRIRYELQVTLELTFAAGTKSASTESIILRKPVVIHRIVYPSAFLQPRVALGLDSGGVEIQVKVPRLLHCENTLLAVEISAKPRARNVKLKKARVVFEQIETDRYQRTAPIAAVPKALPLPSGSSNHGSSSHQEQHTSSGPPPPPRLLTQRISRPLEVDFEEPTTELETQTLSLQLVLSSEMCVDVQSSWLQISHSLRVEIEYSTDEDEEAYMTSLPLLLQDQKPIDAPQGDLDLSATALDHLEEDRDYRAESEVLQDYDDIDHGDLLDEDGKPKYTVDEKQPIVDSDTGGPSAMSPTIPPPSTPPPPPTDTDARIELPPDAIFNRVPDPSSASVRSLASASQYAVATEEIPIRVVRVVTTGLVDATTIAQAAGEMEAGLPTYESVIEATGLPAYAEEKLEDDHEEAEASGTATGVLGGAARRLEGDDA